MSDVLTVTGTKQKLKEIKMWKVTLFNDDFTPVDFVIQILLQVFNKSADEAIALTMKVHETGSAIVGTYSKEVAITKVDQTKRIAESNEHPLLAVADEA